MTGAPPGSLARPIADSYVIPGTTLAAGAYPGSPPSAPDSVRDAKLAAFLDAGYSAFVDLTDPADRLEPYIGRLRELAAERGIDVAHDQLTIRDVDICEPEHMRRILDRLDQRLTEGRGVYVHCWGGIGRTGLVVGCWLVRNGRAGDEALAEVHELYSSMSPERVRKHRGTGSPQTEPQRQMVRQWEPGKHESRGRSDRGMIMRDRYVGSMLGLAVGDALGTTIEFKDPGTFRPVTDMVGGGPFHLKPGEWTDDTSMALCLGESLLECGGFDGRDQLERYVRWIEHGHWSSTGRCFDVGNVVRQAIREFKRTGDPFSGPTDENTAGNGSLMRLAPVPLFFAADPALAIRMAADSSRTTHGTAMAVDACRYYAGLIVGALGGVGKEELLAPGYSPVPGLWEHEPLHPAIAGIAAGSFRRKQPPEIAGTGYVVNSLEAALWAFETTDDFRTGVLAAVNLGDDADTTGAIFGQLGGAYYGVEAIPVEWRAKVALGDAITAMAAALGGYNGSEVAD